MSQALSEENNALSQDADSARAMLAQRGQELAELAAKAVSDAASSRQLVSQAEEVAAAERLAARAAVAGATRQLAAAAAAAREAGDRHAAETGEDVPAVLGTLCFCYDARFSCVRVCSSVVLVRFLCLEGRRARV